MMEFAIGAMIALVGILMIIFGLLLLCGWLGVHAEDDLYRKDDWGRP